MIDSRTEPNLMKVNDPNSNPRLPFKTFNHIGCFLLILLSVFATTAAAGSQGAPTEKEYSDAIASYAALIGFEPMHGNVKDSLQFIRYVEDGKVTKEYFVSFGANGCIESMKLQNTYAGEAPVNLKKIKNKMTSFYGKDEEGYYDLDADCRIVKNIKTSEEYLYENNLISEVRKNGEIVKSFKFNAKNELIEVTQYAPYEYVQKLEYLKSKNTTTGIVTSVHMGGSSANEEATCFDFDANRNPSYCDVARNINSENKNIKYMYKNNYY